ncbi:MAG: sugar transferase [Saprospiraceae bacterium]|nr:sugar transferase [Saprospiraceae bacterium]
MKNIACIGKDPFHIKEAGLTVNASFSFFRLGSAFYEYIQTTGGLPDLILFELSHDTRDDFMQLRYLLLKEPHYTQIPFITISSYPSLQLLQLSKKFRIKDYYIFPSMLGGLENRIQQLLSDNHPNLEAAKGTDLAAQAITEMNFKLPLWKRTFDILAASVLILLSAPILILVGLLIKLESKGSMFYVSKRAGQGFRVFDFYKFRSMRIDADLILVDLKDQNHYFSAAAVDAKIGQEIAGAPTLLMMDHGPVDEQKFFEEREATNGQTFFKIKNDPRVTRIGKFIRATSIDEMPQLINVLKGDMSLVGNRPLPLYEAEKLTSDEWIERFSAPAGITGLWQVSKGKNSAETEEERKQLDITYAKQYNLWMDLKILLLTLPAAFQRADS